MAQTPHGGEAGPVMNARPGAAISVRRRWRGAVAILSGSGVSHPRSTDEPASAELRKFRDGCGMTWVPGHYQV